MANPAPAPDPNQRIAAYDVDGKPVSVPAADAQALIDAGGRVATRDDLARENWQKTQDSKGVVNKAVDYLQGKGFAPELDAAISGVRSGVSFGGVDALVKAGANALGGESAAKEYVRQQDLLKENWSKSYTAGEIGGVVLQTALGNAAAGSGGLARVAGLLNTGEKLGAVASGIVSGEGALANIGRAAVKFGVQGAFDGALQSGTGAAVDSYLHDSDLTAEKLLAATGHGALWGGLTGAVMGGGGAGIGETVKAARGGLASLAKATESAEAATARATKAAESLEAQTSKLASAGEEGGLLGKIRGFAGEEADRQAYRALGGTKSDMTRMQKALGPTAMKDAGEVIQRYGIIDAEAALRDTAVGGSTAEHLLPRVQSAKADVGSRIGELMGTEARIPLSDINKLAENIAGEAAKKVSTAGAANTVRDVAGRLQSALEASGQISGDGTVALKDLFAQRVDLDKVIRGEIGRFSKPAQGVVEDFRNQVEKRLVGAMEERAGGAATAEFSALKRDYKVLSQLEKTAQSGVERIQGNNEIPLRAALTGLATGVATGGPLGAILGLGTALGGKVVHERGHAVGAVLLKRLSTANAIGDVIRATDTGLDRAAVGVVEGASRAPVRSLPATPQRAAAAVERVQSVMANPEAMADHVARQTSTIAPIAPQVASAIAAKASNAAAFLASKIPQPLGKTNVFDGNRPGKIPDVEAQKFLRYYDAVIDPLQALRKIEHGEVTAEAVEALKATSPQLFVGLQVRTIEAVSRAAASGKPLPYQTRIRLGILMDVDADASLRPDVLRNLQAAASGPPAKAPGADSGPTRPINMKTQQNSLDRIESGQT